MTKNDDDEITDNPELAKQINEGRKFKVTVSITSPGLLFDKSLRSNTLRCDFATAEQVFDKFSETFQTIRRKRYAKFKGELK